MPVAELTAKLTPGGLFADVKGAFDRKALASYFQLTGRTRPRYAHVLNADLADLVIADADEPGVLELLRTLGRVQDALFIGALAPPEAAAWMMRPIDQTQVLRSPCSPRAS